MAGASQSTTTTRSQSTSDTYIPEYSQTPFLQEYANRARAMSDVVYNQGLEIYNKNQGNIDDVMRDALSYASPQRIAVDMGMAEAGVQQAGERGRLSAIRDLESYGIDPSSGRYAALDSSNRVMTAAAAAGAGNQQRMANQAAGNAMRQQAIAASLQNAGYMSSVNRDANAYLQTASQLKYPPLGRTSQSTSDTDSQSSSVQTDPPSSGGGSKGGGEKQPSQPKQPSGGGQPKQPSGGREPTERAQKPGKEPAPPPQLGQPPQKPEADPGPPPEEGPKGPTEPYPEEYPPAGGTRPTDEPTMPDTYDWRLDEPADTPPVNTSDWRQDEPADTPPANTSDWRQDEPADTPFERGADFRSATPDEYDNVQPPLTDADREPLESPTASGTLAGYDPYGDNAQTVAFDDTQQIDPITGEPIEATDAESTQDVAGSLYGLGETGGWTGDEGTIPAAYDQAAADDMWGEGATFGEETGTYDAAYDEVVDPGYEEPTYEDPGWEEPAWTPDAGDFDEWGNYDDQYADTDWDDQGYTDEYADWSEEDYYNEFEDDYGADEEYDFGEEDYTDEEYDYGDEDYDWGDEETDYGDEEEYDFGDEDIDYGDEGEYEEPYYEEEEPYYDEGGYDEGGEEYYDEGGYDEGARGGAVMRGPRRGGKRRARIMPPGMLRRKRRPMPTGYRPRPPLPKPNGHIRPAFARGGRVPPPPVPGARLGAPPPKPPGASMRAPQPPQAPRPARGAPMAAPGGPRPTPMGRGPRPMPGNMISANGMPPPTGMPQRMARGGGVRSRGPNPEHATTGGFVSREMSPSGGSKVDDVQAKLNAEEFVIPKDVAMWKGKEFFYKMIAQARKNRSAPNGGTNEKPVTGFSNGGTR